MTIKIADQFEVLTAAPIDDRMVVETRIDIDDIDDAVQYEGMMVFVTDESTRYELKNGTFVKVFETIYDNNPDGLFVTADFKDAVLNSMTTDDLPEGTTNKYFKDASLSNALGRQQVLITANVVVPNDHSPEDCRITTNFQLMQIEADAPCRVRIYASEDGRNNDIARAFGTAVDPDNGMFVDFVITTPNKVYNIAPSVMVFSESDSESSQTLTTITNLDVTQKDINVTLIYVNFGKVQLNLGS
jgi:hypothetical protein